MKTIVIQDKEKNVERNNLEFLIENNKVENPISMPHHHLHDVYELYYLKKGQRYYFIKDQTYYIQRGDLILINPYEFHSTMNVDNSSYERVLIHFQKSYLATVLKSVSNIDVYQPFRSGFRVIRFTPEEQSKVETLLSLMLGEYTANGTYKETHLKMLLIQLFLLVLSAPNCLTESTNPNSHPHHQTMLDAISYIANHYNENLTLNFVSHKFCFSPWYFSRIFKQVTGMFYIEYLNKIRINEAQKILMSTNKNITEIAGDVGFNSLTNFGRVFKQFCGCSPKQYKTRNK